MRHTNSQRDQYINKTFAREDSHLLKIKETLAQRGKTGIHIDAYEGKLLSLWLQSIKAQKVVEIGTLYGYSTLWMAKALPENGKIISIEKDTENFEMARELLRSTPHWNQMELKCGEATSVLSTLNETYDVVFIDADKSGYMDYLLWADKHVRSGGLIIGDNTLLFGHLINEGQQEVSPKQVEVMGNFNTFLSDPQRYESVMIPTCEGMTVAIKK